MTEKYDFSLILLFWWEFLRKNCLSFQLILYSVINSLNINNANDAKGWMKSHLFNAFKLYKTDLVFLLSIDGKKSAKPINNLNFQHNLKLLISRVEHIYQIIIKTKINLKFSSKLKILENRQKPFVSQVFKYFYRIQRFSFKIPKFFNRKGRKTSIQIRSL